MGIMDKTQSKKHHKYYTTVDKKRSKPTLKQRLRVAEKYIDDFNQYLVKIGHFQQFTEGFDDAAFDTHNQCSRRFLERYNFHAERDFQVSVAGQVEGFIADGECREE
tara:strand:+ start:2853 stop:3173 length:321 start_codon:yes stop_codon:yes gene_type:complete